MRPPRVVVAGAGAFGLSCAVVLARRGAEVTICDPARLGDNASGVAAGMIAPAFESLLDPMSGGHFELLAAARAYWPAFAGTLALPLEREGAIWAGADAAVVEARLTALGARALRLSGREAAAAVPGLHPPLETVFTPEDWRIDAAHGLLALRTAAVTAGARPVGQAVVAFEPGAVRLADGRTIDADYLVVATGAADGGLSPEIAALTPVKGHILRMGGGPAVGPVVRAEGIYVRPHASGAVVGATMETGRADREVDDAIAEGLASRAAELFPSLQGRAWQASTGVRATTVDGLPIVGASQTPGVVLAAGARRNGWLLAPMVAEIAADAIYGRAPRAFAAALDPGRLSLH